MEPKLNKYKIGLLSSPAAVHSNPMLSVIRPLMALVLTGIQPRIESYLLLSGSLFTLRYARKSNKVGLQRSAFLKLFHLSLS